MRREEWTCRNFWSIRRLSYDVRSTSKRVPRVFLLPLSDAGTDIS